MTMQASVQPLLIQATVSCPAISMEPAGSLFFKPTCLGASSQRALTLHNTSRVPLLYQVCLAPSIYSPLLRCFEWVCSVWWTA